MFFNSFFRYFLYLTGTKFILAPENGMSEGKSLDRLQDEYMSMPEEELLFQYQTKYEEKPLLHETQERLRTRTHGGRVRTKEE